jgi:hypothetical protein
MDTTNAVENAQLSEATYADFRLAEKSDGTFDSGLVEKSLKKLGFSTVQASDFVENWRVADHLPDTSSGFSATLFEKLDDAGNGTGQYSFAIRGTNGLWDAEEDIYSLSAQRIKRVRLD